MSEFVHHELNTSDPGAAKKFYRSMFGWKFQDMKMPDGVYMMFTTSVKNEGGGIQQHPMPGAPSAWLQYVAVPSVKKAMAKAARLGATILVEYQPIPGHGALGILADPTGATCAVWEAAAKPKAKKKATKKKATKKKATTTSTSTNTTFRTNRGRSEDCFDGAPTNLLSDSSC